MSLTHPVIPACPEMRQSVFGVDLWPEMGQLGVLVWRHGMSLWVMCPRPEVSPCPRRGPPTDQEEVLQSLTHQEEML